MFSNNIDALLLFFGSFSHKKAFPEHRTFCKGNKIS